MSTASVTALLSLSSCTERACTLAAVNPVVFVDIAALGVDDPDKIEVCLDDRCVRIIDSPLLASADEVMIDIVGDESQRTLLVRAVDGETLAGPQVVDIPTVYPNGEGCPGEGLQGRYHADSSGSFTPEDPAS